MSQQHDQEDRDSDDIEADDEDGDECGDEGGWNDMGGRQVGGDVSPPASQANSPFHSTVTWCSFQYDTWYSFPQHRDMVLFQYDLVLFSTAP